MSSVMIAMILVSLFAFMMGFLSGHHPRQCVPSKPAVACKEQTKIEKQMNSIEKSLPPPQVKLTEAPACGPDQMRFLGDSCFKITPARHETGACKPQWSEFDAVQDVCHFYTKEAGIVQISHERWHQAQVVESSVWDGSTDGNDRNEQHAGWFDQYRAVNGSTLGRILEVGCGPFTQTKTILEKIMGRRDELAITSITLADPLMLFYLSRVPSCSYKDGTLMGYPTQFIVSGGEQLALRGVYDTVVMTNVLEHCTDALLVLENMHLALKDHRGMLIFSERWYDTKWDRYEANPVPFWDVMHPINVKKKVIDTLLARYTPLYKKNFYYEGNYISDEGIYFIGLKK